MAGYSREARFRFGRSLPSTSRGYGREPVEYVPVGLPPRSLLEQLLVDLQSHLAEMEKMRVVLVDAYPRLACWFDDSERRRRPGGKLEGGGGGGALMDREEDGESYRFALDVAGFQPEELAVKVDGRRLTVSAKRDRRTEGPDGCVSHEYREVRKELLLPEDANLQALTCSFTPEEGRLCLEAPRLALPPAEERAVPITVCRGPAGAAAPPPPAGNEPRAARPEKGAAAE